MEGWGVFLIVFGVFGLIGSATGKTKGRIKPEDVPMMRAMAVAAALAGIVMVAL